MSSPRLRRLAADYDLVRTEFVGHKYIDVQVLGGQPPESYRVTYRLRGIALSADGRIVQRAQHIAVIELTNEYPRQKPKCVLETPIFHPNFGEYICVGDYWAAGETLADLIVKIGDMIQYRDYNVKSPLNAVAARWAAENMSLLPVGNVDLWQAEPDIELEDDQPPAAMEEGDSRDFERGEGDLEHDVEIVFEDGGDGWCEKDEDDLDILLD